MKDPHLIIYHPVREIGRSLIVTNGDQTDTIWEFAAKGESWEAALRTRMFEDDGPNWTPRISGIQAGDGSYKMSILKAADPEATPAPGSSGNTPPPPAWATSCTPMSATTTP